MAAISNNKYDIYSWIESIIDSCETLEHLNCVERLIYNYEKMFGYGLFRDFRAKMSLQIDKIKNEQIR
jgi:hypothetical protein